MFETKNVSRTPETDEIYRLQSESVLAAYTRDTGLDWDQSPVDLVRWLRGKRDMSSAAYWRRIRAALAWFFDEVARHPDLAQEVRAITTEGCAKAKGTSARKKKSVSDAEVVALANYLLEPGHSQLSRDTINFLCVGVLTGLRPSEWEECEAIWSGDELELVVRNAKATNGRANGTHRNLTLRALGGAEVRMLQEHLEAVARAKRDALNGASKKTYTSGYERFQTRCRKRLQYAWDKVFPGRAKRVSLYSGRHQSVANGKASGLPKAVIAAIHGQGTDRTATDHYGKKRWGNKGRVKVSVSQDQVASVKQVSKDWVPPSRDVTRNTRQES